MSTIELQQAPLGKKTTYRSEYAPSLLHPIARQMNRDTIKLPSPLPFHGIDIWNAYELSWLNAKGKPVISLAEFRFPCTAPYIVESKSFKLYLNSFNNSRFSSEQTVLSLLKQDLALATGATVHIKLIPASTLLGYKIGNLPGISLDDLDISMDEFTTNADLLICKEGLIEETVHSHLLKSNCLVTGQPDWGSVAIRYAGKPIDHARLLQYLVSCRNHNEFNEHCIERIYADIWRVCQPKQLTVYGRYTRRGGLDTNPFRSNFEEPWDNIRLGRQ